MNIKQYNRQGLITLAVLAVLAMCGGVRPAQAVSIDFNPSYPPTLSSTPLPLLPSLYPYTPPVTAVVTDDYESSGIVFGMAGFSAGVAVVNSSGLGTSPVACGLDANGDILTRCGGNGSGDIYFNFVDPAGSGTKATTDFLSFQIGTVFSPFLPKSWDLYIYDLDDNLLESRSAASHGYTVETFNLAGIHRVYIDHTTTGPLAPLTGYALDNIIFNTPDFNTPDAPAAVPEPRTTLLLGSGLLGLLGYSRRNRQRRT